MPGTSVRQLVADLGFKVDTTPATRFDAAVNRSKKTLEGLSQVRLGRFGLRLKKFFAAGAAGVAAVGTAAAVAFNKFSDVAQGLKQLEFQFKGKFKPLKEEIDSILDDKTLGKLTTELELINTAAAAFELGLDPDVFIRSLRPALEFAIVNRKSVGEITAAIASFVGEANLDLLIKLGNLNQRQIELLKTAGVGPGQAGIIARTAKVEELFKGIRQEIQKSLQELVESGVLSQKQFVNTLDATAKELGEKTLPAIKAITKAAIDLLDEFRGRIKQESVTESFFKTFFTLPEGFEPFSFLPEAGDAGEDIKVSNKLFPAIGIFFKGLIEEFKKRFEEARQRGFQPERLSRQFPISSFSRTTNQTTTANTSSQNINITVPVTIQSGASADPAAIKQAVNDGIRNAMGSVVEQSKATTIKRGGP